ncbi:RNA recognition motif domain-containing protein [Hirschfeldia incana]|nr:RNA recognition motif domain-containing protein [Hirschfeldia incana]
MQQQTRSVRVENVSDLATEREIHEFFSFSGDIDHIDILKDASEQSRVAFVTFTEPKALEIALLLSGATIVDKIVNITPADNYVPRREIMQQVVENTIPPTPTRQNTDGNGGRAYVSKAQDVMATVLAKGSALGQDAVNKAKAFDELHQLRANASAKVSSFDKRVRLSEKFNVGISVVNEKVKSVDQRLQVSDKTMAAIFAAEKKLNDTGTAVKSSRYVTAGAAWFSGAFSKVARAGQLAGSKTKEKFNLAVSNIASKDTPIAV